MKRIRKVKIIATLGPSSFKKDIILKLCEAGADVFRINMSHTDHDLMRSLVKKIRECEEPIGRPIGILIDLQGPKLRIGKFIREEENIAVGQILTLDKNPNPGNNERVCFPHPEIYNSIKEGDRLLIDDGKIELQTIIASQEQIKTRVITGKKISSNKGVSLPDTDLAIGALTNKDHIDIQAALSVNADWIALSFIQRPEDLEEAHKIVQGKALLISKIEKPQALDRLSEIIHLSDALMVARGDLGVEMPIERVPELQKRIVREARQAGKPVVIATQMLESMIEAPMPTRAEVSDVSTAVLEGADAIMLSAESASGQYPVEAVTMMHRIAEQAEKDRDWRKRINDHRPEPEATEVDAIACAARKICETLNSSVIATYTESEKIILRIARERPNTSIMALSPTAQTARRLSLVWGTHSVVLQDRIDQYNDIISQACRIALKKKLRHQGEHLIIVSGVPLNSSETANMLQIVSLKQ